jgi:hypothetical protein
MLSVLVAEGIPHFSPHLELLLSEPNLVMLPPQRFHRQR